MIILVPSDANQPEEVSQRMWSDGFLNTTGMKTTKVLILSFSPFFFFPLSFSSGFERLDNKSEVL